MPASFASELLELIRQDRFGDALALCRKWDVAASRVLEVAIEVRDQSRERIKERLEEVGRREAAEMERLIEQAVARDEEIRGEPDTEEELEG